MYVSKISLNVLTIAIITNPYKLSNLKQYCLFSCHSVGQKYNRDLTGLKSKCWQGCVPSGSPRGESVFLAFPVSRSLLYLAHGLLPSFSKTAMSSIFGLQSSYMLEYRWLFALLLRSARCFTGVEGKWTPLPPISPPSSSKTNLRVILAQGPC